MAHPTRSQECSKSELDLFLAPDIQKNIKSGQWIEHFPVSNITDSGPIEFNVSGSGEEFIDTRQGWVHVQAKITNADGSDLADDAQVGPTNLFSQSMFSQVDLTINDKLISSSTNTYPYRSKVTTLLTYGSEAKQSQLTAEMFYKDTAGKMDNTNPLAAAAERNQGLYQRYQHIKKSAKFEIIGPLHLDLFCQDRLLLNGVSLRLRFNRSKNAFCLLSSTQGADFRVKILQVTLYIRKVRLYDDTFLAIAAALQHAPALYPLRRVECKALSIPKGNMSFNPDDLFLGAIPRRVVLGFVDNAAFNGDYTKNPFNFKHFNATQIGVYVNGEASPMKALQLNYEEKQYLSGYMSLYSGTGMLFHNQGNQISRDDYDKGYALYAFDLSPDLAAGPHVSPIKQGNLRLGIQFGKALPSTVNLIILGEFDSLLEIDSNRNITYNWNA